jgi:hypothetical protein
MKSISKVLAIVGIASTVLVGCATRATFVIRERPVEPRYERPAPPYPGAVWIPGEWEWRGNHYVYLHGYYVQPSGREWIPGHWRETPGGYVWDKGHWRNV